MKPGYTYQDAEFDSEILRSGNFQLISITIDATATFDGATKLPKGLLLVTNDTDLTDGTYEDVDTEAGNNKLNGTPTQSMADAVVLAETVLDASAADQPIKAYIKGTFDWSKIKYSYMGTTVMTLAQVQSAQHLTFVDGPIA